MSTVKFNTWQNTDGTENYKCRAWVNFNGTGTVAIRGSGNISSITDRGNGKYTANYTTAMPDANYTAVMSSSKGDTNEDGYIEGGLGTASLVQTASATYITTGGGWGRPADVNFVALITVR